MVQVLFHLCDNMFTYLLQIQRYEGASTIYGPYTLKAFMQVFKALAEAIAKVCASNYYC